MSPVRGPHSRILLVGPREVRIRCDYQCTYMLVVSEDKVHCSLFIVKVSVAPTKVVTIPWLELTAAVKRLTDRE